MFIVPYSNVYGRRILYIVFTTIAVAAQIGSGAAKSYGGVITGRVFYGIGGGIPLGIGAATICDLFTQGERGLYMGIYTLGFPLNITMCTMLTNPFQFVCQQRATLGPNHRRLHCTESQLAVVLLHTWNPPGRLTGHPSVHFPRNALLTPGIQHSGRDVVHLQARLQRKDP